MCVSFRSRYSLVLYSLPEGIDDPFGEKDDGEPDRLLTFHVQLNFFPLQTAAVPGRASVLSLVAHVHLLYIQTSVPEHLESRIVQIVHSRVPVPLDGRFGITFGRAVQHHRVSLDRLSRILRLDGKLWRNWNNRSRDSG